MQIQIILKKKFFTKEQRYVTLLLFVYILGSTF